MTTADLHAESIIMHTITEEAVRAGADASEITKKAYTLGTSAYLLELQISGILRDGKIFGAFGEIEAPNVAGLDPSHSFAVYEFQRRSYLSGPDKACVDRLLAVHETDGELRGYMYIDPAGKALFTTDAEKAFQAIGLIIDKKWHVQSMSTYVEQLRDSKSDARGLLSGFFGDAYHMVAFEFGYPLFRLYTMANADQKQEIAHAVLDRDVSKLYAFALLDDPERISFLTDAFNRNPEDMQAFADNMVTIYGNIDDIRYAAVKSDVDISMIQKIFAGQVRSLFSATIVTLGNPHFSWEYPRDTLLAMQEIMFEFCGLDYPNIIQMLEVAEFGNMEETYLTSPAMQTVLDAYLNMRALVKFLEDKPGAMARESQEFYAALGSELYANRSETTGDKTMQLLLVQQAIGLCVNRGLLPDDYEMLDAGSGPMEFLSALQMALNNGNFPKRVLAVDRDRYAVPDQLSGLVTFEQADLTSAEYALSHKGRFDLALHMWSPINDNEFVLQKVFLDSINRKLKVGGIALIEAPIGYVEEMLEEMERSGRKTRGRIVKSFGMVEKPFEITSLMPLLHRLKESGLKALNWGDEQDVEIAMPLVYVTASGQKRAFIIAQKIGEPTVSIDQLVMHQVRHGQFDARKQV